MGKIELVSHNAGLRLLRRNTMCATYQQVVLHYYRGLSCHFHASLPRKEFFAGNPTLRSEYDFLKVNRIGYRTVEWTPENTSISNLDSLLHLSDFDKSLTSPPQNTRLIFAADPLCTILYRLYSQVAKVLPSDALITIVRTKMDKTVLRSNWRRQRVKNSVFNQKVFSWVSSNDKLPALYQFKGILINPLIPPAGVSSQFLTKDACKPLKGLTNVQEFQEKKKQKIQP